MMDEKRALLLIGADPEHDPDREDLEDMLGDAVFEEARYFMRRAFIPKLADARIRKLNLLCEAQITLLHREARANAAEADGPENNFSDAKDLETVTEIYHRGEAWAKRMLSAAEDPAAAALYYEYWIELHDRFAHRFCTLYEAAFPGRTPENGAKLSENIDFNEVRADLNAENRPDGALHRYYSRLKKMI